MFALSVKQPQPQPNQDATQVLRRIHLPGPGLHQLLRGRRWPRLIGHHRYRWCCHRQGEADRRWDPQKLHPKASRVWIRPQARVSTGVNFTNILRAVFTSADAKSAQKTEGLTVFIVVLGSVKRWLKWHLYIFVL